ncbi:hypothetical protein GQ457_14G014330 [Hibiscus cannabinus]
MAREGPYLETLTIQRRNIEIDGEEARWPWGFSGYVGSFLRNQSVERKGGKKGLASRCCSRGAERATGTGQRQLQ